MAFARIHSAQNHLLKAHLVSVEIDLSKGLHSFSIVGLPNKAVEESRDRVSAAIKNSGYRSPKQTNMKVTVSLAPANLRKEGPAFDLPIAVGYLLATKSVSFDSEDKLFVGELSLDGSVRPVRGVLSFAELAIRKGMRELYVPVENSAEAAILEGIEVFGVSSLSDLICHLSKEKLIDKTPRSKKHKANHENGIDLDDIVGHDTAKRGLIIAAAGGHNIGLFGPPGTGKTMLARALQSILPPLSFKESLEVTGIYSASGHLRGNLVTTPPMRAPHHTSSHTALIGGGSAPKPGEVTLAHRGILFLDELAEFDRKSLEALRQPIEDGVVSISRVTGSSHFPARFMLVVALNPCPCGNKGAKGKRCSCSAKNISRYEQKISGPIADRIDMWIEVSTIEHDKLMSKKTSDRETRIARAQIIRAREIQALRFMRSETTLNSDISVRRNPELLKLSEKGRETLGTAVATHDLSGRGYHRILKLARTIADIDGSENVEAPHIYEALQYRKRG